MLLINKERIMTEIQRTKGIVSTSIIGIVFNFILAFFKIAIGIIVSSTSILSDGFNNFSDSLSAIITIIGTKLSSKRPTKKYPFGFGRLEYISSTIIGIIILMVGILVIRDSIEGIISYWSDPTHPLPSFTVVTLIIIGVAIFVKLFLGIFYKIQGKRHNSLSLKGSGTDALFDALLSTLTLISALVAFFFQIYIEGYVGIVIGGFIIKSGVQIVIEAMSHLIGKRGEEELAKAIKQDILSIEEVNGVYDLILNNYGNDKFIASVHIEVKHNISAHEIQELERQIQTLMYTKYSIIMTVGIYVENEENEESQKIKSKVLELIHMNKNIIQIHGFYVDKKDGYVNFDLVYSFDEKDPVKYNEFLKQELTSLFPLYRFIINVDYDYA